MRSDLIGFHHVFIAVNAIHINAPSWVEVYIYFLLLFFISANNLLSASSFKSHSRLNIRLSFELIWRSTSVHVLLWGCSHLREITISDNSFGLFTFIHEVVLLNLCVRTSCGRLGYLSWPIGGNVMIASLPFSRELTLFNHLHFCDLALVVLLLAGHLWGDNLVCRRGCRILAELWVTFLEVFIWVNLNDTLSLSSEYSGSCATFRASNLRGHIGVTRGRDYRWLVDLLPSLRRILNDLAAWTVLHLCESEGEADLGVIFIVILEIPIEFVILRVVKQCDPLLILIVLLDCVVQKVLLQRYTDRTKELFVV